MELVGGLSGAGDKAESCDPAGVEGKLMRELNVSDILAELPHQIAVSFATWLPSIHYPQQSLPTLIIVAGSFKSIIPWWSRWLIFTCQADCI